MSRRELANAIRALSMDAVENANSGHPGMPMGMADIAEVLWNDFLQHNPANPSWFNRDRFVLSNGHGCMLLYAALHLSGYDLPMGELKRFRQLHSLTPGHPESGHTPGIEVTTGPLGQGLSNSVGLALAEALMAKQFNRPEYTVIDHYTYVFCGDGDLMEGVSHEAGSLAGTLGLGKLIVVYDDNGISIDGKVSGWFRDDTARRFEGYGWQTIGPIDGHDSEEVRLALETARADPSRPTLILARTVIGYGAPNKQGTASTHGSPLGKEEVAAARQSLGWNHPPFKIPEAIYAAWDARERGQRQEDQWNQLMSDYAKAYPDPAKELRRRIEGNLPSDWNKKASAYIEKVAREGKTKATRKASGETLAAFAPALPEIIGGSADLTPSNDTYWPAAETIAPEQLKGNYLHWGVREFGMSGALNGIAAHGGFVPYGGTFLVFSDYARNAVRVASIAKYPTIFVYTHDSIGVGEDGPTHQPVEHVASLRAMPGLVVWRPADDVETAVAWKEAIDRRDGPSTLIFTRQAVPHFPYFDERVAGIRRGGYVLHEPEHEPVAIILASGSEVALAMEAAAELNEHEVWTRVVSLPSHEVFLQQDSAWREQVLPAKLRARVAVEAAASMSWYRFVGLDGHVVALDRYGESAPGPEVFDDLGITSRRVGAAVRQVVERDKNKQR